MMEALRSVSSTEAGSPVQKEFERDQKLAEKYLNEVNAKDLYELYQQRCLQLEEFGKTLLTMAELYSGKGERKFQQNMPEAIQSMERVALAAIELAKAVTAQKK